MSALKQRLFTEYGGFADPRIKDLKKSTHFIVDDRAPHDIGPDGRLLKTFCSIFVDVLSEDKITLRMTGNIPKGKQVTAWVEKVGNSSKWKEEMAFTIKRGETRLLDEFALAIESIVAPDTLSNLDPSYEKVCPRTARSLRRLAKSLSATWGS